MYVFHAPPGNQCESSDEARGDTISSATSETAHLISDRRRAIEALLSGERETGPRPFPATLAPYFSQAYEYLMGADEYD